MDIGYLSIIIYIKQKCLSVTFEVGGGGGGGRRDRKEGAIGKEDFTDGYDVMHGRGASSKAINLHDLSLQLDTSSIVLKYISIKLMNGSNFMHKEILYSSVDPGTKFYLNKSLKKPLLALYLYCACIWHILGSHPGIHQSRELLLWTRHALHGSVET